MRNNLFIICYTPTKLLSEKISLHLLKKKLSSCISISKNIQFVYTYKKKICKENEYKITIKTNHFFESHVIKYLKNMHPYKQPIIIKNLVI